MSTAETNFQNRHQIKNRKMSKNVANIFIPAKIHHEAQEAILYACYQRKAKVYTRKKMVKFDDWRKKKVWEKLLLLLVTSFLMWRNGLLLFL